MIDPKDITIHCTWPVGTDFPLFRRWLANIHPNFPNQVISFSNNHQRLDLTNFLKNTLSSQGVVLFDAPVIKSGQDWRNEATRAALGSLNTKWIWFLEPDFFVDSDAFFPAFLSAKTDIVAYPEADRLHPCCLLVLKELLDKTSRDFSSNPGVWDHFGLFGQELKTLAPFTSLPSLGLVESRDFLHLTGLTHNYDRFIADLSPTNPEDFLTYNHVAQRDDIQDAGFLSLMKSIEEKFGCGSPANRVVRFVDSYL